MATLRAKPVLRALPGGDTPAPTDADLVERARAGDPSAEEALYRRHAPSLLTFLSRVLTSEADGLDAMQDAFVIAFRKLRGLRDPSRFGSWLRQTGMRCALRTLRRRRLLARLGFGAKDTALELVPTMEAGPEVRVQLRALERVLLGLPDEQRIPWMLRYVDGYELTEVAELANVSLATAKRKIAAAQAVVRSVVELEEGGA
jgi:RNA polymerase sigma-70 factor (ECF subfamily)